MKIPPYHNAYNVNNVFFYKLYIITENPIMPIGLKKKGLLALCCSFFDTFSPVKMHNPFFGKRKQKDVIGVMIKIQRNKKI